jgi:hypothetical protein
MKEVGLFPADSYQEYQYRRHGPGTSRRIVSRFGIELPKPPPRPLPKTVYIGSGRNQQRKLELSRPELFERVWGQSMVTLAREWGLSDRGLAKACRRLKIPVPPRGYWARKAAGKAVRKPQLPDLNEGEAELIVVWLPA